MNQTEKALQLGVVCLLILTSLISIGNLTSDNTQGTDVSGPVFDGSGGPWTTTGSPYIVVENVTIPAGETLTIEAGVEVKFDGRYNIFVDGALIAVGTEGDRINITSNRGTPAKNDWANIQVNPTGHAEIRYCNISYGSTGIYISTSSNNNITNNTVAFNGNGIMILSSSSNLIVGNTIYYNNGYGIRLFSSSNNTVYHNNIIDNQIQVKDDTDTNTWNDSYPSGGNYWSTYSVTCIDVYDGAVTPQTGLGGPDGICDSPWPINADSKDYYPLVDPVGGITSLTNGTISGRVVNEDMNPVEGAQVNLEDGLGELVDNVWTDASGEFEFTNVTFGTYSLIVYKYQYGYNDTTKATISVLSPSVDVGDIVLIMIEGTIVIDDPQPNETLIEDSTAWVEGYVYSDDMPSGVLQDVMVTIRLIDTNGNLVAYKTGTTTMTGHFSVGLYIPNGIEPGQYTICASVDYGAVPDECVPVTIKGWETLFPWWIILLVIIAIIVMVVVVVVITLMTANKDRLSRQKPGRESPGTEIPPPPGSQPDTTTPARSPFDKPPPPPPPPGPPPPPPPP